MNTLTMHEANDTERKVLEIFAAFSLGNLLPPTSMCELILDVLLRLWQLDMSVCKRTIVSLFLCLQTL